MNICEFCGPTEAEVNQYGICEDCHMDREAAERDDQIVFDEGADLFLK
jgi:hypothetical protein